MMQCAGVMLSLAPVGCRAQEPKAPEAPKEVTLTLQKADLAAIPGSKRSLYADVEGTRNIKVNWTAEGGCTLASPTTNGVPQVVTAPAKGSSCKFSGLAPTNLEPSFQSAVSCKVTATSAADVAKSASIVIPVCSPDVTLSVFPGTIVLYKKQFAVIQSNLRGSVETGVRWEITKNPGGAGSLSGGNANRHAIFSATAAGSYVLTATSVADASKKAEAFVQVTEHDLPAPLKDHTEAVDCTGVGGGRLLEVGPSRELKSLDEVNWARLQPGDTVRIHNEDTTGQKPTEYHQHIMIGSGGTPGHPIRVCGVPDANGVKPIIDGANATSRAGTDWSHGWLEDLSLVQVWDAERQLSPTANQNSHVIIEGIHFRNANPTVNYMPINASKAGTKLPTPFRNAAACVRVENGRDVLIRGNVMESCTQGVFTNARTPEGAMVYDLTVEGNYLLDWGWMKNERVHGMYLQSIGLAVQFNYFGPAANGAMGNAVKTRSVLQFVRWNYLNLPDPTTGRAVDMVEPQAFSCYVVPNGFSFLYHAHGVKNDCGVPRKGVETDPVTANEVAANFEAYHSDYVYGNVVDRKPGGPAFVHYGYDQSSETGPGYFRRGGTLYWWNNTHYFRKGDDGKPATKAIFDLMVPDGSHSYEFPRVQSVNNVFEADAGNILQWTRPYWAEIIVNSNWVAGEATLPDRRATDFYQTLLSLEPANCNQWGYCKPANGEMRWLRGGKPGTMASTLYTGPTPFDGKNFLPAAKLRNLSAPLPEAIRDQPSNMEYLPATNEIRFRPEQSTLGALQ